MTTDDLLLEKEYIIRRVLQIHFMPKHICSKYRIELDDLMQVGRIALWEASKKFRPKENGTSFDTYAHQIVRLRLLNYLEYLRRPIRQLDYSSSIFDEITEDMELLDVIPSDVNVEMTADENIYIESTLSNFTTYEKVIFQLKLTGYTYIDIERKLEVKGRKFRDIKTSMLGKLKNARLQTDALTTHTNQI